MGIKFFIKAEEEVSDGYMASGVLMLLLQIAIVVFVVMGSQPVATVVDATVTPTEVAEGHQIVVQVERSSWVQFFPWSSRETEDYYRWTNAGQQIFWFQVKTRQEADEEYSRDVLEKSYRKLVKNRAKEERSNQLFGE